MITIATVCKESSGLTWWSLQFKKIVKTQPLPDSGKFSGFVLETDCTLLRLFEPNEAAEHLQKTLNLTVEEVFPEKQSKIDMRKNKPWFNFKLKKMKDERTKEYLKNGHSKEFIELEEKYDKSLKEAKREFKEEKITQALKAKNYKEMFKNIKHLAGI